MRAPGQPLPPLTSRLDVIDVIPRLSLSVV